MIRIPAGDEKMSRHLMRSPAKMIGGSPKQNWIYIYIHCLYDVYTHMHLITSTDVCMYVICIYIYIITYVFLYTCISTYKVLPGIAKKDYT